MLTGDIFIATAAVSYLGPLNGSYREQLITQWVDKIAEEGITCSPHFSLARALSDPVQVDPHDAAA
jgi:dynein heavy chain